MVPNQVNLDPQSSMALRSIKLSVMALLYVN